MARWRDCSRRRWFEDDLPSVGIEPNTTLQPALAISPDLLAMVEEADWSRVLNFSTQHD